MTIAAEINRSFASRLNQSLPVCAFGPISDTSVHSAQENRCAFDRRSIIPSPFEPRYISGDLEIRGA
jgi:hypothetical protein